MSTSESEDAGAQLVVRCRECDRKIPREISEFAPLSDTFCAECKQPFSLDEIEIMFSEVNMIDTNAARVTRRTIVRDLIDSSKRRADAAKTDAARATSERRAFFSLLMTDLQVETHRRINVILGPLLKACETWRNLHRPDGNGWSLAAREDDNALIGAIDWLAPCLDKLADLDSTIEKIVEAGEGLDESGGQTIKLAPEGVGGEKLYVCMASGRISRGQVCVWHPEAFSALIGYELSGK